MTDEILEILENAQYNLDNCIKHKIHDEDFFIKIAYEQLTQVINILKENK